MEIHYWTEVASAIPDPVLRTQALASLQSKRFHADGGSVYAAVNLRYTKTLVRLIIALQTISDYLDNLCDRCNTYDEVHFNQLHHAMRDAVRPGQPKHNYYEHGTEWEDGGYLERLVDTCRNELSSLPGYKEVSTYVEWLIERYCELQVNKHIEPCERESRLVAWWEEFSEDFPHLHWWEFAAATGSTLGVFSLFLAATEQLSEERAMNLFRVYFPWIGGLHILLDYLIDLDEDKQEGDYNFVACYENPRTARNRISWFATMCLQNIRGTVSSRRIHRDVVHGLLGMYLSDDKVKKQKDVRHTRRLLWRFGPTTWMYYGACMVYRWVR